MTDPLGQVLRLVAEGRLTAEEAEPILDALDAGGAPSSDAASSPAGPAEPGSRPRFARIEVTDGGRRVVNLRVPLSLGWRALSSIPGLSTDQADEIRSAVDSGIRGSILDVTDEDGDGARIVLE
jgi:SHOCT-like protein